jgi:hypothetical protein
VRDITTLKGVFLCLGKLRQTSAFAAANGTKAYPNGPTSSRKEFMKIGIERVSPAI